MADPRFGFPPLMFPPATLTQTFGQDPSTQEIPPQSDPRTREIAGGRYRGRDDDAIIDQLTDRIIKQESSGRSWVVGRQGEIGLGQIMPSTAAQYGVQPGDLYDPKVNRALTRRILGDLYKRFNGNLFLTAAAYNTGPGNVNRGRIPSQTRAYANKAIQGLGDLVGGTPAYAEEPPAPGAPPPAASPTPGAAARWVSMMGPGAGAAPAGGVGTAPPAGLGAGGPAAARGPQGPVDMSRLAAMTAHLPADRQRTIRDKALAINQKLAQSSADPAIRQKLLKSGGLPSDTASLLKTGESPEDIATDIKHPWYGYVRRPGTRAVDWLARHTIIPSASKTPGGGSYGYSPEQVKQLGSWTGHTFFPQTPTQAALTAATAPMGWAESAPELLPEVEQGLEGLPAARQALRPLVSTLPRRMLGMAGIGAGTSALTGDSALKGAETGLEFQAPAEIVGGVLGGIGRLAGKGPLLSQTESDISATIGKKLPVKVGPGGFNTDKPFNLQDWKTPDKAFREVQDMLRPDRDMIHMDSRVRKLKFPMPIVKGGQKPGNWAWGYMSLKNAEEQLTRLGELGYLKSGEWKTAGYSRDARKLYDTLKGDIAKQLPSDIRAMWEGVRDQSGAAAAYRRLFKDTQAIDPETGELDQAKLAQGIKDDWGDLQSQLGRDGVQDLWNATTRMNPRGPLYRGSPYKGAYKDRPGHWMPRFHLYPEPGHMMPSVSILPETYRPIGNVPIWMYPPRGAIAPFVGPPTVRTLDEGTRYPPRQQ